jgi:hypothetical protein
MNLTASPTPLASCDVMQPMAPTIRHTHGFRGQLPVSGNMSQRHSQTDSYATVGVSMPPGPLPGLYVGLRDLWSGLRT